MCHLYKAIQLYALQFKIGTLGQVSKWEEHLPLMCMASGTFVIFFFLLEEPSPPQSNNFT